MAVAYVPYGEQKNIIYSEEKKTPQPYYLTKTEYASIFEGGYTQVIKHATNRSVSGGGTMYTVPQGFTLFITNTIINISPTVLPAGVNTGSTRIYFDTPTIGNTINYLEVYTDPALVQTHVSRIQVIEHNYPIRVAENQVIGYTFTVGGQYYNTSYMFIGYLQPNQPLNY